MNTIALLLALFAAEPGVEAGWFRLEVPDSPPAVTGVFLGRGGEWVAAKADLDGDGRMEATLSTNEEDPIWRFEFTRGERRYEVELWPGRNQAGLMWTVIAPEGSAFFINGEVPLRATREEAARVEALRLGGPLSFAVSSCTRGPDTYLSVGVTDANGSVLRTASVGDRECRIHVRLLAGGKTFLDRDAEYG